MNTALAIDRHSLVAAVRRLPSLPVVVLQLLGALRDPGASVEDLATTLSRDQALSARVLQLANSPFYGVSGRVQGVRDGVSILGLRQLGSLVLAASMNRTFDRMRGKALPLDEFRRHSMACAIASRGLASSLGLDETAAFTAGLLHDVGRLVLDCCYPDEMERILVWARQNDLAASQSERELLGIDHSEIGGWVCEHWRFPAEVTHAIRWHHAPPDADSPTLADVVHVGDALAHALDLSGAPGEAVPDLDQRSWSRVAPVSQLPPTLLTDIEGEFESLQAVFQSA